jgi:hypothetical protein
MKRLDPKKELALSLYKDPKSQTFGNLYKSLLEAGFGKRYSREVLVSETIWLRNGLSDHGKMVRKAEKNLEEILDERKDRRLKFEVSKFVAERLDKKHYSPRTETLNTDVELLIVLPSEIVAKNQLNAASTTNTIDTCAVVNSK